MLGIAETIHDRLVTLLAYLGGASFVIIALAVTTDILARNTGAFNIPWLVEVVEYSLFFTTLLVAPWTLRQGAHVRVDLLVGSLPPAMARLMARLADLLGLAISACLAWYGGRVFLDALDTGALLFKQLIFPEWYLLWVLPVALGLLGVEFLLRLLRPGDTANPAVDNSTAGL